MPVSRPELITLAKSGNSFCDNGRHWRPSRLLFGVVGDPVRHSLSPIFQNAALDHEDFVADYVRLQLGDEQLELFMASSWALGFRGFNVTSPHKERVFRLCRESTGEAKRAEAVNTVRVEQDGWLGHNTDIAGIRNVLDQWKLDKGFRGIVLGAGGSARAAILALADAGAESVAVVAREGISRSATQQWIHGAAEALKSAVSFCPWDVINAQSDRDQVVVSCLPAGVATDEVLGPARGRSYLLDMRYGTQAIGTLSAGWTRRDGSGVLLAQGAEAFRWWFRQDPPIDVMTAALESALD